MGNADGGGGRQRRVDMVKERGKNSWRTQVRLLFPLLRVAGVCWKGAAEFAGRKVRPAESVTALKPSDQVWRWRCL